MKTTFYVIENGDLFYGTLGQFKDCFFSNADTDSIKDWCEQWGYDLKIMEE